LQLRLYLGADAKRKHEYVRRPHDWRPGRYVVVETTTPKKTWDVILGRSVLELTVRIAVTISATVALKRE
jgi:hypothetical protein